MTEAAAPEWFTAAELAAMELPEMPSTKRGVSKLAAAQGWDEDEARSRPRKGRGGGREYHLTALPRAARIALTRRRDATPEQAAEQDRAARWEAWGRLTEKAREKAAARLEAIQAVEALEDAGCTRSAAVEQVAAARSVSARSLWSWIKMVEGVERIDRLVWLAPGHQTARRKVARAEISPEAWERFKAFYLSPERRTLAHCYDMVAALAAEAGWAWPSRKTVERRVAAEIPHQTQVLAREGEDAFKALAPAQIRDRTRLHAMQCVNGDAHKIDVFVKMPDGRIMRPMIVAFQDVYSGRLLSYRVDESENAWAILGAFGDLAREFGVPDEVVLDNGRGFASKLVTGGVANRFRFKVKDDDPLGVMPKLGCKVHWTIPYNGRAKPIERAFRDLSQRVAKDPRFAGAYVGNRPDAKPENYGSKAVDYETFCEVLAEGVAAHNLRRGRRGQTTQGRSFVETFDASYETAPIRRATEEALRLCLMGAVGIRARAPEGKIEFQGNVYWAEWMPAIAGQRVTVRFDPADLHGGLWVEDVAGRTLGHAACIERVGFLDVEAAQAHGRANRARLRAERQRLAATRQMLDIEAAAELAEIAPDQTPTPAPNVVRPVRPRRGAAAAQVAMQDIPTAAPVTETDRDAHWDLWMRGQQRLRLVEND